MADNNEPDPLDRWLNQQVQPLPPPPGTFELITKRARRRRVRKTLISVASAAAVVAAIGVAVPLSTTLHLSPKPTDANMAAGSVTPSTHGSHSISGTSTPQPTKTAAGESTAASSAGQGRATGGYLPPNFRPTSVTWDSTSTGWVLGPAGTPGKCANVNPDVCTSVARTGDGGQTWHGLPAPDTVGVTGLRFLNASYGWAFGSQLWATNDGGATWHPVNTGGLAVTDLETIDGRAYALFATCATPAGGTAATVTDCTSYTLKTATAGSDDWTPVSGVPASLGSGNAAAAVIELAGATQTTQATGYLIAPDGTLYAGPADGGAWHSVSTVPCPPSLVPEGALNNGQPLDVMLAPLGTASSGTGSPGTVSPSTGRLALVCSLPQDPQGYASVAYVSNDGGATWTKQSNVGTSGTSWLGQAQSLTSISTDGTLILATSTGIYRLPLGTTRWQPASVSDPPAGHAGFSFVGMTSPTQGVALAPGQTSIWMTTDGGQTWQPRPIKS